MARNRNLFTKADFVINMRNRTIECPAGEIEYFQPGSVVELDPDACGRCVQRARCTMASPASGRTIRSERRRHPRASSSFLAEIVTERTRRSPEFPGVLAEAETRRKLARKLALLLLSGFERRIAA